MQWHAFRAAGLMPGAVVVAILGCNGSCWAAAGRSAGAQALRALFSSPG